MMLMKNNKKSNIAAQLTCAALALPGLMQTASAGRVEETYNADFQYGHYEESNARMRVDIFEGALSAPIGKSMTANVSILRDTIAGASVKYNEKDAKGNITHVRSGASAPGWCGESICEQRDAANAGLTYFFDKASLNLGGGFSREQDYMAKYFNTALSLDLNKKLTTLNFGASVSFDEVQPTNFNIACGEKCSKTSQQYLLGISQVIDKDSLLQSNISFGYHNGYMTDPYKMVGFTGNVDLGGGFILPLANVGIHEKRPEERFEWAWLTQYVRHFEQFNHAALHADYRFSTNDWGINAHTLELSWHQPIADGWQVIPRFRYYSQDKADFYQPTFSGGLVTKDPNTQDDVIQNVAAYSSDYRLAGFGTFSGGLKFSKEFTELKPLSQLKLQTGFEYYSHKAEYQLGGNNLGTFDNFGYYLVTASFNLKF
jgi:Protein of unknown function (DUF3570)